MSQQLNFLEPVDIQTKPVSGNTKLVDYGIQNDKSDYRVHVGYRAQHIYVFPTQAGRDAIAREEKNLQLKRGSQNGTKVQTFAGYPVPVSAIDNLQSVLIPIDIYQRFQIQKKMTTSIKGLKATQIVVAMLKRQLIALPLNVAVVTDEALQGEGTDIIVHSHLRIQVKCDFSAGERQFGGTGNLFLQTAECNPRKLT